jgi:hypothetical protein
MVNTPLYRIRDLMIEKYSEEKFELGCLVVARWVTGGKPKLMTNFKPQHLAWTTERVKEMCVATSFDEFPLSHIEAELLRRLFGLRTCTDLFTFVETTPAFIQKLKPAFPW